MAEPGPRQRLEWLAAAFGVDPVFDDVWGHRHEVSDAGLRALLGQLGVPAVTDADIDNGLTRAHLRYWQRLAEPVVTLVLPASTVAVLLRLPRGGPGGRVAWRLLPESGDPLDGEAEVDALALRERSAVDGVPYESRLLVIEATLAPGYHRLDLQVGETRARVLVIAAPPHCFQPPLLAGGVRVWGWSVQLYGLRSARNWGVGDFGDLLALIDVAAARGASAIGLNPLHARFPHNPAHASPYAPSSRLWLDALAIDVESVDDFAEADAVRERVRSSEFRARLQRLRDAELVDLEGVSGAKHEALRELYAHFRHAHLERATPRAAAFRAFQSSRGAPLRRHALFEALQARFHAQDPSIWGWPVWPEEWRDPGGEQAVRFEVEAIEAIEYYEYLQWQAERQLERAAARCREHGMAVGLYLDLAVSVDRAGSDCWAFDHCYAASASVGAPPDDFNLAGQDWGLPPLIPDALRECGHEPFVLALRANMRHAGALRIDHVMGLMRLYWVPPGATARDGGYVRYPMDELLAIVSLESHRNRCLVVGEDLGTVPDAVRDALARARVLSYRLLYFERDRSGDFARPDTYPHDALVSIGTHDLPTLAGWWASRDLQLRDELGLFPDESSHESQVQARAQDRARLVAALIRDELLAADTDAQALARAPLAPELVDAVHVYLARSPARLMMVQPEDWLGVTEQANLPGTVDTHPNWRRRLSATIEELAADPAGARLARALAAERESPRSTQAAGRVTLARIPRSTYRLQLNREFGLRESLRVLPYLDRLGVGDLYCSPVLRARPGSSHGYDIVDHRSINPELGGEAAFDALSAALRERGMGVLFDMVPNHMGVLGVDNAWWMDVLENGEVSPCARFFDIDWHPVNGDLDGKVLVPLLGDHYGLVLERGELVLAFEPDAGGFAVRYHEHRLPIDPRESASLLRRARDRLDSSALDAELRDEFSALADAFANLPPRDAAGEASAAERARDAAVHKRALARLAGSQPAVRSAIDAEVEAMNARSPGARNALHALLEQQAWRLAYWRVASDEINYRRFFDINDLAGLRIEDEAVFEATHARVLELAADGRIDGLRIDHPDGLYDPGEYFARLQQGYVRRSGAPPEFDDGRPSRPLYVVIEKIAAAHERVPEQWAIHGTTGYRFAAVANGLFVDPAARDRIDRTWRAFTGERDSFEDMAYEGRQLIMRNALAAELTVLASELLRIARANRRTRDYTFNALRRALADVAACIPVYRTYLTDRASKQDRRYIQWAIGRAVRRSRAADTTIYGFVREALLGRAPSASTPALRARTRRFARRFQQFTSPVAAKGVEDTALYRFNRLVSLNEVGSEPDSFGISVKAFHAANADRAANWPHTMLATSTHDNKRSGDVRARIDVLSEMPAAWRLLLRRWRLMNRSRRSTVGGDPAPSRNDEYLLYQTLLGSFQDESEGGDPARALAVYAERIERYMLKAARESKARTSWISPDPAYESALAGFVRGVLAPSASNPFLDDLREQMRSIAWFGALNSLAMVTLKYTVPGVPDLYQGNECFDFSLVDPDNRRPVDFERRSAMLESIERRVHDEGVCAVAASLSRDPRADAAKMFVTWRLLQMRRARAALFRDGDYLPLEVTGAAAPHLVAYARRDDASVVVVLVSRLFAKLLGTPGRLPEGKGVWQDTVADLGATGISGDLVDQLTGRTVTVSQGTLDAGTALSGFPAAVLLGARPG
ncbi:MAG: malto-oligosyltrehalose synthase [Burkholderiaceae bacterium]|nr:malto-oligosyltrehalose synthase [Burkholderiaceae bacterium]